MLALTDSGAPRKFDARASVGRNDANSWQLTDEWLSSQTRLADDRRSRLTTSWLVNGGWELSLKR